MISPLERIREGIEYAELAKKMVEKGQAELERQYKESLQQAEEVTLTQIEAARFMGVTRQTVWRKLNAEGEDRLPSLKLSDVIAYKRKFYPG